MNLTTKTGQAVGTQAACSRCGEPADASPRRCKACAEYNKDHNPARAADAYGGYVFNSTNKKMKEAAIELYGAHRIKKSAHSRYVAKDFTSEEQVAIEAKTQSGTAVVFLPPVDEGLDFPLRKQVSRVLGDESDLPKTRKITGGIKSVEHEHFNMQKGIQDRNPAALLEKDTIDSLFKSMGGEVKYDPTPGDFEQAVGKLALIRASDAAKELAVIFNRPPKLDAVALKALALFGVVWIHQTPSTMAIYNEQFAGPDTKEFVDIYNGVFRP